MKRALAIAVMVLVAVAVVSAPEVGLSEDEGTLLIARALYALGKDQPYDALLALGTVVMNRLDSPWFPDTIEGVVNQPQQFPYGSRYDARTLSAAREVLAGARALDADVTYYAALDATARRDASTASAIVGNYGFYTTRG